MRNVGIIDTANGAFKYLWWSYDCDVKFRTEIADDEA